VTVPDEEGNLGFGFIVRKNGDVAISRDRRSVTTLRGASARTFLVDVARSDPQQVMARLTGNYRRGNERTAARHSRNTTDGA